MEENRLTFAEIREMALREGIADNKVSIGLYAKVKGYKKICKKDKNKKSVYYYVYIQA